MSTPICIGPECTRTVHNHLRQLCKAHVKQWYTNGALKPLQAPRGPHATTPGTCTRDDCDATVVAKGLCNRHYDTARRRPRRHRPGATPARDGEPVCQGPQCDRVVKARGLCAAHYTQRSRGSTLTPVGATEAIYQLPCAFPGCDRTRGRLQWCKTHREQERSGRPMRPIGQYRRDLVAEAERRRANGETSRRRPKPTRVTPATPAGWNRKTKPTKAPAVTDPTAAMSFLVPQLPPEMYARARRNLVAMGADDLLDMLGLGDVA